MEALKRIQQELVAPKGNWNDFSKFNYRSAEDILHAIKPLLETATITLSDEIVLIGDRFYVRATVTLTDGQESVSVSAYARESEKKKGMDSAQVTGATSSYARKYALGGMFAIDNEKDPDTKDNRKQGTKPEDDVSLKDEALEIKYVEIYSGYSDSIEELKTEEEVRTFMKAIWKNAKLGLSIEWMEKLRLKGESQIAEIKEDKK